MAGPRRPGQRSLRQPDGRNLLVRGRVWRLSDPAYRLFNLIRTQASRRSRLSWGSARSIRAWRCHGGSLDNPPYRAAVLCLGAARSEDHLRAHRRAQRTAAELKFVFRSMHRPVNPHSSSLIGERSTATARPNRSNSLAATHTGFRVKRSVVPFAVWSRSFATSTMRSSTCGLTMRCDVRNWHQLGDLLTEPANAAWRRASCLSSGPRMEILARKACLLDRVAGPIGTLASHARHARSGK